MNEKLFKNLDAVKHGLVVNLGAGLFGPWIPKIIQWQKDTK